MAEGPEDDFVPDTPCSASAKRPKKKAKRAAPAGSEKKSKKPRNCKYGERTLTRKAMAEMAEYGPSKPYDIPYFAHQQLDPDRYPISVGMPIGGPPAQLGVTWDSESDSDQEAFLHSLDYDDEFTPPPRATPKAKTRVFNSKSYRSQRLKGGRPPIAKKVTADLDSDDELIVKMKQAKYLEKDIAARLAAEGRTSYHAKTIGTRWARLKRALQKRQDELLDEDLTDWHEGDDDALAEAVEKANIDVERGKKAIEDKKWRLVADHLKALKASIEVCITTRKYDNIAQPVVDFSQNACRDRFEALQKGTAKPTPESVENPDESVRARVQSRIDKENKIKETAGVSSPLETNLHGNGWI